MVRDVGIGTSSTSADCAPELTSRFGMPSAYCWDSQVWHTSVQAHAMSAWTLEGQPGP